jgi:AcrR family transcriptional regulator
VYEQMMKILNFNERKTEIFQTAIKMFYEKGFNNVSIRDIVKKIGINASSFYNHFQSKNEILTVAYDFYEYNYFKSLPKLDDLLCEVGEKDPLQVLHDMFFYYDEGIGEWMDKIILIAFIESNHDERAANLIKHILFEIPVEYYTSILNKMIEKEIIEPIDSQLFGKLMANIEFATTIRNNTLYKIDLQDWIDTYSMLLKLIHFKDDNINI